MLRVNETLLSLNIAKHQIRDLGARILSQNLLENRTLKSLNLRCNQIGIGGGEALAALLMRESALEQINLACNKISEDGARLRYIDFPSRQCTYIILFTIST
jgi:hypothetical protein